MGKYTEHWENYKRKVVRDTLRLLGVMFSLIPIGVVGFLLPQSDEWPLAVVVALLLAWLTVFVRTLLKSCKVDCPRCATVYTRGKYLRDCPQCGLRMLQEDP